MKEILKDDVLLTSNEKNPLFLNVFGLLKNNAASRLYTDGNGGVALVCRSLSGGYTCCFTSDNTALVDEVVDSLSGDVTFCGISSVLTEYVTEKYACDWLTRCGLFVYDGTPYPATDPLLPPMDKKYWQRISEGTPYRAAKEEIEECLDHRLSSALYEDGAPVCWCLLHTENSLGMLYTLPPYRHKGYALRVMTDICRKMTAAGDTPYCYIIKGNVASEKLAPKYHLRYVCDAHWCGFQRVKQSERP